MISPHVYPPTITGATVGYSGASLNARLSTAHGYLNKSPGFCSDAGACKTFPIAVGEFGTRLLDARDLLMMPQARRAVCHCCILLGMGIVSLNGLCTTDHLQERMRLERIYQFVS